MILMNFTYLLAFPRRFALAFVRARRTLGTVSDPYFMMTLLHENYSAQVLITAVSAR
jgi:hypothetical protein